MQNRIKSQQLGV